MLFRTTLTVTKIYVYQIPTLQYLFLEVGKILFKMHEL